jgi:hypothetical protein
LRGEHRYVTIAAEYPPPLRMSRLHLWRYGAALFIAAAVVASLAASSMADGSRTCGELARRGKAGPQLVTVRADGVGCRRARQVVQRHIRGQKTKGWRCNSAGSEAWCTRGPATVAYGPASSVRSCGDVAFILQSDNGAFAIVAKRTSCRWARQVARGSRHHGPSRNVSHHYRAAGFNCDGVLFSEAQLPFVLYTCQRGNRTVAFDRT